MTGRAASMARLDSGAALLTVLVQVAVVSLLASLIITEVRSGIVRTRVLQDSQQAHWYMRGAITLASDILLRGRDANGTVALPEDSLAEPFVFPLPDGSMQVRLSHASACFNVNSLVEGFGSSLRRAPAPNDQYRDLLAALGFDADLQARLADTLADWMDSDNLPSPRGAEDASYANRAPPYRTSGRLLADLSELRAIEGYTADIHRTLRPFLCAGENSEPRPININALQPWQAPLIMMLTGGGFPLQSAISAIQSRPPGGYTSQQDFWRQPVFDGYDIAPERRNQIDTSSRYFWVHTEIAMQDFYSESKALLEIGANGEVTVSKYRLGALQ